jgi:hypothetical protein
MTGILMIFCSLSFFAYGFSCLYAQRMVSEFARYRLSRYRKATGILQIAAATGLLLGFFVPWVGGLASAGLALQMACGLGVRVKIRDRWFQCLPAGVYMILCYYLSTRLL